MLRAIDHALVFAAGFCVGCAAGYFVALGVH